MAQANPAKPPLGIATHMTTEMRFKQSIFTDASAGEPTGSIAELRFVD